MKLSIKQGVKIIATGSAVPNLCISNNMISEIVETSDEWIQNRTGIKERRILPKNKSLIDIAASASIKALKQTKILASDIELIILATSSPNDLFGSASQLQAKIGANKAVAFDITAACSGFIIAMVTAAQFIQNGTYSNVLIVGADALSKWIDWSDRRTCILFGDGAGAAILQACCTKDNALLGFQLNTNGQNSNKLCIEYEDRKELDDTLVNISKGKFKSITMNGKEVYKFAVSKVPESINKCLESLSISTQEINWLLLHQANTRILTAVANRLMIPEQKIISNLEKYGNTSAASIPLALDEAIESYKIKPNDLIIISGFGAGLTWGTIIVKWTC